MKHDYLTATLTGFQLALDKGEKEQNLSQELQMSFVWATRGRTWGFRFLQDGGAADPLVRYEAAFLGVADEQEVCHRVAETVALRFPDPMKRKDAAGRVIPHEFVIFGSMADQIGSVEDGRKMIWPMVAEEFAGIWDQPKPPSSA